MRGRSARARSWGRWRSRWRSSSTILLPPSPMIGHYPGRNLNKENFLAHTACISLTGMISFSSNSCAQPLSTRFIHHIHTHKPLEQVAALSMLSKYLRARRERPQYFATSHPDLSRFHILKYFLCISIFCHPDLTICHRKAKGERRASPFSLQPTFF